MQTPITTWGTGEPVILIHGSGDPDPVSVWQHQRPLAAHYHLLIPTRPGYGERPVHQRTSVDEDVEEIIALLVQQERGHVVGFSYGGCIALLVSARRPDLIRSLTLIEPPAFALVRGDAAVEEMIAGLKTAFEPDHLLKPEEFLVRFMHTFLRSSGVNFPGEITLSASERKGIEAMMAEPAPWELEIPLTTLENAPFPTLVISGNWDPAFEAVATMLAQRLHAQYRRCEGQGHYIADSGEPLNQVLETFLSESARLIEVVEHMKITEMQLLFDYYYWATEHILNAAERVSDEQFVSVHSSFQRSLRATLVHALSSERTWRARWQGDEPLTDLTEQAFPTVTALRLYWKLQEQEMRHFLSLISENDLTRRIEGVTDEGTVYADFIWHSMMHVLFHGAQHRSEAAAITTEYGFSPGELDFFVFLRHRSRSESV
jgi:pimeloyl-ACP methyl ester carboxylesterase/uncharacterized damage-inducible protein DinB